MLKKDVLYLTANAEQVRVRIKGRVRANFITGICIFCANPLTGKEISVVVSGIEAARHRNKWTVFKMPGLSHRDKFELEKFLNREYR